MSTQDHTTLVEYRTIARFPGYLFGSDGVVYGPTGCPEPTKLWGKPSLKYLAVHVRTADRTAKKMWTVHRLILEAFVGPCPDGHQACHVNGNRFDNRPANLRWGTSRENNLDRLAHGTMPIGSRNGKAKLTTEQVAEMRKLRRTEGLSYGSLGRMFGISANGARSVCLGINRKYDGWAA